MGLRGARRSSTRSPEIAEGMCHDNARHFDKAVESMSAYVAKLVEDERIASVGGRQEVANAAASRAGIPGTAAIELPPDAAGAPTTDAPGESPKDVHADTTPPR